MNLTVKKWLARAVLFAALTTIDVFLARFAVLMPSAPGVAGLYFAVAFMVASSIWFGAYGVLAAYAGCILGAGLGVYPPEINMVWSLADALQALIPLVAFRTLKTDPGLLNPKSAAAFLAYGVLINNFVGAAVGASVMVASGTILQFEFTEVFLNWFAGNVAVCTVVGLPLLFAVTPVLKRAKILISGYI